MVNLIITEVLFTAVSCLSHHAFFFRGTSTSFDLYLKLNLSAVMHMWASRQRLKTLPLYVTLALNV